jgi:hypothetical protein
LPVSLGEGGAVQRRSVVLVLRRVMEGLLGVVGGRIYHARTGRHYYGCEAAGGCVMAAIEEVCIGELDEERGGLLWLCSFHAGQWHRGVTRARADYGRAALLLLSADPVTGVRRRVRRSRDAVAEWANRESVGES